MSSFVIAVDGPAASGKGTIATLLGQVYGLPVLDTGLLYRAVGMAVLEGGAALTDEAAAGAAAGRLDPSQLNGERLRGLQAGEAATMVAVYPGVRAALRAFQRAFAAQPGGAVIDGRDIGTVIVPDAPAKLFVTATPQVRAERRLRQLPGASYEAVLADILRRDARDSGRADAPLAQATDAVLLDTTNLTISAASDAARRIVEAARAKWEQSSKGISQG